MAFECVEWVKRGGALPDVPELLSAMTQTTYTFKGDKMIIEPKEIIKTKLGFSPDHFDSLMLGFAQPVLRGYRGPAVGTAGQSHQIAYDALGLDKIKEGAAAQHQSAYVYDPRR